MQLKRGRKIKFFFSILQWLHKKFYFQRPITELKSSILSILKILVIFQILLITDHNTQKNSLLFLSFSWMIFPIFFLFWKVSNLYSTKSTQQIQKRSTPLYDLIMISTTVSQPLFSGPIYSIRLLTKNLVCTKAHFVSSIAMRSSCWRNWPKLPQQCRLSLSLTIIFFLEKTPSLTLTSMYSAELFSVIKYWKINQLIKN